MEFSTIIVIAALVLFILIKRMSQISADEAKQLLRNGAVLLDVRTSGEYSSGTAGQALNLPLDQITARAEQVIPDKDKPILVFCLSGTRSAMAKSVLQQAGYKSVHNLGSLNRAKSIMQENS